MTALALLLILTQAPPEGGAPSSSPATQAAPAKPAAQEAKPPATPAQEKPAPAKPLWQDFCCFEKGRAERDGLVTIVYEVDHTPTAAQAGVATHQLLGIEEYHKMLLPFLTKEKGHIEFSNRMSALSITDTKENIGFIQNMFQILHTADAPVMIEAKVVELRWDNDLQIGLEGDLTAAAAVFTQPVGSEAFFREARARFNPTDALGPAPFQGSTFRFQSVDHQRGTYGGLIQAFVERGKATILSQPRVLVKADETAIIFAGDEVPFPRSLQIQPAGAITTFEYRQAGVRLEVQPHIAAPGQVSLRMKPEVTSTLGFIPIAQGVTAPQFTVRSVSTELLVRDGEEVVIGGLYQRNKSEVRRGLPFLSDIPLLGYLFGKYEEAEVIREILFFIKPTVIRSRDELPRGVMIPDK